MARDEQQSQGVAGADQAASKPLLRLLRSYAWRYRWSYLGGFLFLWLTNQLTVTIPGEIGMAVDALRASAPLGRHVAAIAGMGVAVIVVRSLSRVLIFNPGRYLEYHLRQDLFSRLLLLQPSFYAVHKRGDIVSRASNDIGWVRTMVGYGGLQVVNVSVALVLTCWKMLALSPRLTLLVLLPVLLGMTIVQWSIRRLFHLSLRNQEQLGEISEHVLGSLQGIATIQSFVAEESFVRRFEERNQRWLRTGVKLALIRATALPLLVLSGGVALYMVIQVGGSMVQAGSLTVGQLTAFTALLTVLMPPLRSLGWMLSVMQRGKAALMRIFELIETQPDRPEGSAGLVLPAGRGPSFTLRDVSFAYPDAPRRTVLRNVSITIPAGAVVGLFGRTGSGKSTLLRLLARLYNPPQGSILVDGHDLTSLELDEWRRRLAVVPQRPFLFSDSIAFNVAMGEDGEQERIRQVTTMAALAGDIEALPKGIDTTVGERGIMLSGGQRQRVALARGLFARGDVLMLDDVLSAVDHSTEAALVETLIGLGKLPQAPTVLIASHRLSALRHADLILVLDRGRLVDHGTHRELLSRPGLYRTTWQVQTKNGSGPREEGP